MSFFDQIKYLLNKFGANLLKGTLITILLAIVGTFVGLLLGMGLALIRNLKINKKDNVFIKVIKVFFSKLALCYIQLFRGTPMMVQAMLIYFGGNLILLNAGVQTRWNALFCGLVIITLNTAAYMAEIVRSGINSIDIGQTEAAKSLGMNHFQTMTNIIFPQALKNVIPTIGNELIVNIKDSSVLNVIGVVELYYVGKDMMNTAMVVPAFAIVAIIYLILTIVLSQVLKLIENKLDHETLSKSRKIKMETVTYDD